MKQKIKVMIADDHEVVRTGLATIIEYEDDITCVGTAKNGQLAVELAARLKPDVVIMDLMMPVMDGVEATRAICAAHPATRVLILTSYGSPEQLRQALDCGAAGAMLKSASNDEIIDAARELAAGRRFLARDVESMLMTAPEPTAASPQQTLNERQLAVLNALTRGYSNTEIAKALNIKLSRVKKDLVVIFERIGAASRTEATAIAIRDHLVPEGNDGMAAPKT